ncbi:phosphoribosylaminoimidazole carboxylase ade2 [Orbilia brochopaga]|uniref:Adenylosuccinate synthetase n=1 Tax=Orbilia brochopaga TaxID=3140254 RepID=A0AAV9V1I4_9PEZI
MAEAGITVVLGTQWGDEGKGKLVDILCGQADVVARCQGGNNAGHTIIVNNIAYDFHLLPSGLVNPKCENLIGSGVVIHIPSFFAELAAAHDKGLDSTNRIFISSRAHIVLDLHQIVDGLQEVALGKANVGTTRKGIGPTYSSKAARSGLRIEELDLRKWEAFEKRFRGLVAGFKVRYGELLEGYDEEAELSALKEFAPRIQPYVVDAVPWMDERQRANKRILVEGANALMLDLDYGTYPYVTSSNTGIGGVFTGLAISPFKIREIVGVVKAYTTRVGGGPFPTEQLNDIGEHLQTVGREVGVTTGRRRRCGWLDLVVLKHSMMVNHYTSLNLTKLDVLDDLPEIKVAVAYKRTDDGTRIDAFPADLSVLKEIEPVYETLPGWKSSIAGLTKWEELPAEAKGYVEFVERFVGARVGSVGVGPARENMLFR